MLLRSLPALVFIALLFPATTGKLNGIPFNSFSELIALLFGFFLLLFFFQKKVQWSAKLLLLPLFILLLKGVSLFFAPHGFQSCHSSFLTVSERECAYNAEYSFTPSRNGNAFTRYDNELFFTEKMFMQRGYLNQFLVYNRQSAPFKASWEGDIQTGSPLFASYTGKVTLILDSQKHLLGERDAGSEIALPIPLNKRVHLKLHYSFNPLQLKKEAVSTERLSKQFENVSTLPALMLYSKKRGNNGTISKIPLTALSSKKSIAEQCIGFLIDVSTLSALLLLSFYAFRKHFSPLFLLLLSPSIVAVFAFPSYLLPSILLGFALTVVATAPKRRESCLRSRLLPPSGGIFLLSSLLSLLLFQFNTTIVQSLLQGLDMTTNGLFLFPVGDDGLTYESLSRLALSENFLKGGEDAYFSHPFFRYYRAVQHLLFGDGTSYLIWADYTLFLNALFVLLFNLARFCELSLRGSVILLPLLIALLLAIPLAGDRIFGGLQEPLAQSCIFFAVALFFNREQRSETPLKRIAFLLAIACITRINYIPGIGLLFLLFLYRSYGSIAYSEVRSFLPAASIFAGILLLPLLHNLYYGGEFAPFVTMHSIDANAHAGLLNEGADVLGRFLHQANYLFVVDTPLNGVLASLFHLLQFGFLALFFLALRRRLFFETGFLLIPFAFLLPHLLFVVDNYYPRHIMAGYLLMAISLSIVAKRLFLPGWRDTIASR